MKPGIDYVGITTVFYCNDGNGRFLLMKRGPNCRDEQGTWEFGGGQLEFGVECDENILQEVREEYGCDGTIQEFLPPLGLFRNLDGQNTHWLAIPAFVLVDPNQAKINEPQKFDDIGWFTIDNLPTPMHKGAFYAFNKYHDYFEKYSLLKSA